MSGFCQHHNSTNCQCLDGFVSEKDRKPLDLDTHCMLCGGTDITKSRAVTDSEEYQGILRNVECENCGASWSVIYRVGGYTNLYDPH